jgi:hypothetical protein
VIAADLGDFLEQAVDVRLERGRVVGERLLRGRLQLAELRGCLVGHLLDAGQAVKDVVVFVARTADSRGHAAPNVCGADHLDLLGAGRLRRAADRGRLCGTAGRRPLPATRTSSHAEGEDGENRCGGEQASGAARTHGTTPLWNDSSEDGSKHEAYSTNALSVMITVVRFTLPIPVCLKQSLCGECPERGEIEMLHT